MISPEDTFSYYNKVFEYLSTQINRSILFKQRKTYQEVNNLLRLQELDFAFICSGAYVEAKRDFNAEILVVPQIRGKTNYYAYIIVRNDSGINNFMDLRGKRFAFTDRLSNTGCLYPLYLVAQIGQSPEVFFQDSLFTYAHDQSIHAVENRIVDGASVDGLIYDYIKDTHPLEVSHLNIIKRSIPFGMPPVVVHPDMIPEVKEQIRRALLNMAKDERGREVLFHLRVDRFVMYEDSTYDSIREMKAYLKTHSDGN
jgi:phosphonate transport system substrate-binding protein